MEDCIFCKIINKEIPCYKIYEDENVLAFLDIAKKDYGHTLVIPKKHYKNCVDCDEKTLSMVISVVKKIGKHYVEDCGFNSFVVLNANGEEAGQTVFHLHFHIVPKNSELNLSADTPLEEQQARLRF